MAFSFADIASFISGGGGSSPVDALFSIGKKVAGDAVSSALFDKNTKQTPNRTRFNRQGPSQTSSVPNLQARRATQPAGTSPIGPNARIDNLIASYKGASLAVKAGGVNVDKGAVKTVSTQRGISF
tara:strand:+ start:1152 stop:1529 length:378 start_codon:yes stop_codon:yes gene_type:complete